MIVRCEGSETDACAFERASRNESRYGIRYTRDIYQQERDIARGLVAGASSQRHSFLDAGTLAGIVNSYFGQFEAIFDRYQIDLVLVWPRTAKEAVCMAVAEMRGAVVTYPYTAKYKNFAYWADGAACGNLQYRTAYEAAGECDPPPQSELVSPGRPAHLEQHRMAARFSLRNAIKQTVYTIVDRILLMRIDWREGRLGRVNRLSLATVIGRIWSERLYFQRFAQLCEDDFEKLTAAPFLFFAFQNEPEFSVQMRCKEFNDQGAIVRQLALALPAGFDLIVKEHTFLGGHTIDFYRDLVSLPNIIMAHPGLRAIDLIPKASIVASLAGTVTLEAAFQGKPSLIFSDRSEFALLPSVRIVAQPG